MRLIAVSLSSRCVGDCPFCYVDRTVQDDVYGVWEALGRVYLRGDGPSALCFEYGGYNLGIVIDARRFGREEWAPTMTTMPSLMTGVLAGALKAWRFSAVSLSYDSAKCDTAEEWVAAARRAKSAGLQVGCNYLIERVPLDVPEVVVEAADQLNLLSLKPPGKLRQGALDVLELEIMQLNGRVPVAVDNCLGIQLGHTDQCAAGKEFIHILSDGTVVDCCFGDKCFVRRQA